MRFCVLAWLEVGHSCIEVRFETKSWNVFQRIAFDLILGDIYEGLLSFLCGTGSLLNGMLQHPKSRIGCCSRTLGFKRRRIIGDASQGTFMYSHVRTFNGQHERF